MFKLIYFLTFMIVTGSYAGANSPQLKKLESFDIKLHASSLDKKLPQLKLADLKNHVVMIDFWASWCEPCKVALPEYQKLYKKYKDKGLLFVAVNEDDDAADRDVFIKKQTWDFTIALDPDRKLVNTLNISAIPTLIILNKKSEIVSEIRGFDAGELKVIEKKLEELLK